MSYVMPQGNVIKSARFSGLSAAPEKNKVLGESLPQLLSKRLPKSAYATLEACSKVSEDDTDSIPHRLPKIFKHRPETVPGDTISRRLSNNMIHLDERQTRFLEVNKLPNPPHTICLLYTSDVYKRQLLKCLQHVRQNCS
ncbi:uncharacterized protein LOC117114263 [Anneissia japonica]|uniref:uncharacterized protein LOC117114263 n=1 Tax=Anneissia japonica TaxID=1529436 RepID=UPI001425B741|nr:uncharacterized protein LOC117114263 [Anneissia japonica]